MWKLTLLDVISPDQNSILYDIIAMNQPEMVSILLSHDDVIARRITEPNGERLLPIHLAAEMNVTHLKIFLEHGQSINMRSYAGVTPLHSAVSACAVDVVGYLLNREDCDINAKESGK